MAKGTGLTEKPIIFSAPMVRALLAGRKTMTRRVFVPPAPFDQGDDITIELATGSIAPKWAVGDRLWVRETAAVRYTGWHHVEGHKHSVSYAADENEFGQWIGVNACGGGVRNGEAPTHFPERSFKKDGTLRWASPIHMPRWASRLTLAVTEVRVERLQDISEEDAAEEGVVLTDLNWPTYRTNFAELWRFLHGPEAWAANPWVAAITFEVHRANIDAIPAGRAALAERGGAE